jgi:(2Fe-2S) ferredoxin
VLERILREHVMEGRPVEEYVIAERPLPAPELERDERSSD